MKSLRARLILGLLAGITLFLALSGALIFSEMRARMYRELDQTLATIVMTTSSRISFDIGRHLFEGEGEGELVFDHPQGREDLAFQVWVADEDLSFKSHGLEADELPREFGPPEAPHYTTIRFSTGAPARVVGVRIPPRFFPSRGRRGRSDEGPDPRDDEPRDDEPGGDEPRERSRGSGSRGGRPALPAIDLALVRDTTELEGTLAHLRLLLVLAWVSSSVGCAGILWWGVSRSLRPLEELGTQIERLDERRFDERFQLTDTPTELQPIVDQLNDMLLRMGRAFEQEQAFSGYAAHELRTPLAGLRSTLEVSLSRERDSAAYAKAVQQCLVITGEMQTIVEDLLDMARASSPPPHPPASALLVDLVEESWQPFAATARERGQAFVCRFEPDLDLESDLASVRRILANLFENAVEYADEGADIVVLARAGGGTFELAVENDASAAPPDIAVRAFDALWRADASRTQSSRMGAGAHTGLGLALCQRLARTLGGRMEARFEPPRVTFRLVLPTVPSWGQAQARARRAVESQ